MLDATNIIDWVKSYTDSMYSWALYKTSSKEAAEDIVQETFLAAYQSINTYEGKSNPKTWLFGILNNKINDHHRANFKKPFTNDHTIFEKLFDNNDKWNDDEKPKEWNEETGHLLDNLEFQKTLDSCMGNLPKNWFSAIQLKYIEEKKSKLICQELEITDTNFWQILHRAKLQLRKCLELNWFKK